jgi:hypothetical protein
MVWLEFSLTFNSYGNIFQCGNGHDAGERVQGKLFQKIILQNFDPETVEKYFLNLNQVVQK